MPTNGILLLLLIAAASARLPTLRDLVSPHEQYSLRDTLSRLVEFEYNDSVPSADEASADPAPKIPFPSIHQLNANYTDLLFQGDIRLSTQLLSEIVDDAKSRRKRTAFRDKRYPSTIWTNGVPYAFHRSLSAAGRRSVLASIQFYRAHTCIRFRRRTKEPVYLLFTGHDEGCWSTVGRDAFQGQQIVSIGPGCEPFGITSHEVAHALGLFHEQSRYDRDYWITVYPNRIPRSQLYNFAKVSRREMALYGTPYDMGSVMQYTPFENESKQAKMVCCDRRHIEVERMTNPGSKRRGMIRLPTDAFILYKRQKLPIPRFSIDPRVPSMIAVNPNEQSSMGQLAGPSYLDVDLLNRHYACLTRCPFPIECFNGGMQNPHNCRRCKCPSGYGGLYCGSLQAPTIPRCGRRIYARKEPRRMRVKIVAAPRATRPRTCVFHIVAPAYTRVYLEVEKVQGLCVPGCWRETAEFKVRMDKRITGNRFCCKATSTKRVLSNTPVVPFVLKAVRKSAEITFRFRFVRRSSSRSNFENIVNNHTYVFADPVKMSGDQFEFDIQEPLPLGSEAPPSETDGGPFHDDKQPEPEDDATEELKTEMEATLLEMRELEPDLEAMVHDDDVVEIEPVSQKGDEEKTHT